MAMELIIEPFQTASFQQVMAAIEFEQRSVTVYGKTHPQPRLTKWYSEAPYTYSNLTWPACPMPPLLDRIRQQLEGRLGMPFNSVLCNLYRDGSDCVGWHSDNEPIFGENPAVASLSFGATRMFKMRHKTDRTNKSDMMMQEGYLLFMGRGVQAEWEHCVPRTKQVVGPRINLTYRHACPPD